jgi:DnaJ domain
MPGSPPPSDFTAYLAAIARLGLQPGASIDAVRAAYRRKVRDCHPDRFPNDSTKEAEAKALNAARDLLEQMSSDGRSATFAMMAERTRRTGGSDTTADALNRPALIVAVIIAPAGMGKTRGWARSVSLGAARRPALLVRGNHLHIILSAYCLRRRSPCLTRRQASWRRMASMHP